MPVPEAPNPEHGPDPELVKKVMDIQTRSHADLVAQKGIVGTATGLDDDDNLVIRVYTTGADNPQVPKMIEGVPVVEVMKGPIFKAQSVLPIQRQRLTRPVPIGVSVFSDNACSAGTLGARLVDANGVVYALSTNHVFARDHSIVNSVVSGNPLGTQIVQPAPSDNECTTGIVADQLGPLVAFVNVISDGQTPNSVDAALIRTTKQLVNSSTPAGRRGYGSPASTLDANGNTFFTDPFLGQLLQKFGRTSGYTQGKIVGLNSSVTIPYGNGSALFTNQIEVIGIGSFGVFGTFGDSGSLAVDFKANPIGLLFATNASSAFLNPFDQVIQQLSFIIDSQLSTAGAGGSPPGGGTIITPPGSPPPPSITPDPAQKEARGGPNAP